MQNKYSHDELFELGPQRVYGGKYLNQISFPIGGIGTGSVGLTGIGQLQDWEIFNRPNFGTRFARTFPIIRIKQPNKEPISRVLEGPIQRPYTPLDGGHFHGNGEGFPHMDKCEFRGEYPFAWINFHSDKMPLKIKLEAYNPFIPSDPDASGFPCIIFRYYVTNTSEEPIDVSILWNLLNISGFTPLECRQTMCKGNLTPQGVHMNTYLEDENVKGLIFGNMKYSEDHPYFGNVALASPDEITYTTHWKKGPWFSSHYHIWNYFKEHGKLENFEVHGSGAEAGAIAIQKTLQPGECKTFKFYITWYYPTFVKYWENWKVDDEIEGKPKWKNFYAQFFENAFDVAVKLNEHEKELHEKSMEFHDALFKSTLPPYVIDSIASNMSILKTTTCVRLEDGTFYGWEGCHCGEGCCEGSCTHVWGYQQALPFLFPSLERSMHTANYKYNQVFDDLGALEFRMQLPLGESHGFTRPCADGQFGGIMHVYREWKLSGDDDWLKSIWETVKLALEFAWEEWDEEKTGILREFQHNTYDIDFYGPNPMLSSYYLGALKAGAEIARYFGDDDSADEYMGIYMKGRKWFDENLFNGEYYVQLNDPEKAVMYQVTDGCLIDQVVGQQIARIAGLENYLNPQNIKETLKSIFKYNWKPNMREHENGARLYAVNDEAATVICTWPKGGRQEIPFPYADEVMNGFEYQFGVHLLLENLLEEGLTVIKSIRERYDGWGRNPWDEFECGHHYARSMASYGSLIALSGFMYDKGRGMIGFDPKLKKENFRTFWSMDKVWGIYNQQSDTVSIKVLFGTLDVKTLILPVFADKKVSITSEHLEETADCDSNGNVNLNDAISLQEDKELTISCIA